ncbi:type IV toxin-antitoxin system AbiEi family antitoxin domain-containing protein [Legionella israelensis]|uniref:DUF6088 family protein n=1 Tax=Legionella israelensis TaxID=454 RepID=UPI00117C8CA9|nr:DUF6088 family protein [Legionella israelensis]QDP73475.1 type IV toxin-antitoxin system AbiEi family antitoxin domain-containing protein [Legionella israelensis]
MKSASDSILRRIRAKQRGWVFTPKDFLDIAPRNTVGVTLLRLVEKGIIRKIGHGIYDFPVKHPKLGTLSANPDAIARAVASKKGETIQPGGAQLANQLGFDEQVSATPSYITSGTARQKKIADYPIKFSHSNFIKGMPLNPNVIKVLNGIHHIGKNNITDDIVLKSKKILSQRDKAQLKKILNQLPDWMIHVVLKILGK